MGLKIDKVQLEIVIKNDPAKKAMIDLRESIRKATEEKKRLVRQYGKASQQVKDQEKAIAALEEKYEDLFSQQNIVNLSLKELADRQRQLNNVLRNMNPNTPEYRMYREELDRINLRMRELRTNATETRMSLSKLTDGFNRYAGMVTAGLAAVTGVTLTMRKCVDDYAEIEEAMAQLAKYTDLDRTGIEALNEEFKRMDTRTPRVRLNALAADAGRLGIQGKDNILEFVRAADMINVALGEDLGKDAVKNIGKLAEMFGDGSRSMKENMLAIGSAVNSVAQSSSAAEPYLVEFTARMGGVGKQAKMAVTDIMGYGAVLDQQMLRSEMASTALQGLVLKIYQTPAEFARLVGIAAEDFKRLVSQDMNEAVLVFLDALGKLGDMDRMAPILDEMKLSGAEAAGVISALAANIGKVREEQRKASEAFREGTSIGDEFAKQNGTVQAGLDKAKESFADVRRELGERLLPVMKFMVTTGGMTVKAMSAAVGVLVRYGAEITAAAAAIAAYRVAVNFAVIVTKAYEAATKAAAIAAKLLDKAAKMSPIGLMASAVAAVTSYLFFFRKEADETTNAVIGLNEELDKTRGLMDKIAGARGKGSNLNLLNDRQKVELRRESEELVRQIEDRIAQEQMTFRNFYEKEKMLISLRFNIDEKTRESQLSDLERKKEDKEKEIERLTDEKSALEALIKKLPSTAGETIDDKEMKKRLEQMEAAMRQEQVELKKNRMLGIVDEEKYQQKLYEIQVAYLSRRIERLKAWKQDSTGEELSLIEAMAQEADRRYKASPTREIKRTDEPEEQTPEEDTYEIDKYRESLEGKKRLAQAYYEEGLISKMEYERQMTDIERQETQQRETVRKAYYDTGMQLLSSMSQLMGAMQSAETSKIERKYDRQIKAAKKAGKDTTALEEKKEEEINAVKKKYANKQFAIQVLQVTASTAVTAMEAYKAMAGIPVVGPALGAAAAAAAVIAGAAQIAIAKQQRDDAMGLYTGGYTEGYTDKGNPKDVAGVIPVHKNEFVANHEAVANPHVKRFLDVFDAAQRNGTIRVLDTARILQQAGVAGGRYAGGYTSDNSTKEFREGEPLAPLLQQAVGLLGTIRRLMEDTAERPVEVDVRQIRDGIRRIERMERNAAR